MVWGTSVLVPSPVKPLMAPKCALQSPLPWPLLVLRLQLRCQALQPLYFTGGVRGHHTPLTTPGTPSRCSACTRGRRTLQAGERQGSPCVEEEARGWLRHPLQHACVTPRTRRFVISLPVSPSPFPRGHSCAGPRVTVFLKHRQCVTQHSAKPIPTSASPPLTLADTPLHVIAGVACEDEGCWLGWQEERLA